jgi:hypothetical protein
VAPVVNGIGGTWANDVSNSVGLNIHMAYPEYGNFGQILGLVRGLGIQHIREGASIVPGNAYVISSLNALATNGIHADLIGDQHQSFNSLTSIISQLNAGVVEAVEGPNEIDNTYFSQDMNWVKDDQFQQQQVLWPYAKAHAGVKALGPSTAFTTYASIGDLSNYEDFGNDHAYEGGFPPETLGWGGPGYCGEIYATIKYNICNAKQGSITKPIYITEFGYNLSNQPNGSDELAQGTFDLRQLLQDYASGAPRSYIYALLDSGGQNYGLVRNDGSLRPSYKTIAGFMNLVNGDTADGAGACVVPATVAALQSNVYSYGVCKQSGEYDLVLWRPVATYDTNALTDSTIIPITVNVALNSGFTPTNVSAWTFDTTGTWSNTTIPTLSTLQITDRPTVLVMNGGVALPTPMPALPTPLPAGPAPLPTPTAVPTPAAAATVKPTIVTIFDHIGNRAQIISGQPGPSVNSSDTFTTPIQYGDFIVSGWAFGERFFDYGVVVNRNVVASPPGFTRVRPMIHYPLIDPTNPGASYFSVGAELLSAYMTDQYASTNYGSTLNWTSSVGLSNSHETYRFRGVDAANPIAVTGTGTNGFNVALCPSVTAPRPGSIAIAFLYASGGSNDVVYGFPAGATVNGWNFDDNIIGVPSFTTYSFHFPTATTVANQVLPAFSPRVSNFFLDQSICEVLVLQPPL